MTPFTKRVIELIQNIPAGHVMTYGQVAKYAGSPKGARQVVRILHSMSEKHNLPWHRVINAKGEIALREGESGNEQKQLLVSEGVKVKNGNQVNLEQYLFHPDVSPDDLL